MGIDREQEQAQIAHHRTAAKRTRPATPTAGFSCARAWPQDEVAWALDCFASGDTPAEIAQTSGRPLADVLAILPPYRITDTQRDVLSLYAAGCSLLEIERELGRLSPNHPGHAASNCLANLRRNGVPVPHRKRVA